MEILNKLLVSGLNTVIVSGKSEKFIDLKQKLFNEHFDVLVANLEKLSKSNQMLIMEHVIVNKPECFQESFWQEYIEKSLNSFSNETTEFIHSHGAWLVLLNRAKDFYTEVDWFDVLISLSIVTAEASVIAPGFQTVLTWLVKADSENLRKLLYRTETKKYPRHLKVSLYTNLIKLGLLDQKIARRIRSDSSGQLSTDVLAFLFSNRGKYSEALFKDLISQFCDTKHKWVARFISLNMPKDLIPFLFSLDDKFAVKILEQRLYS